jgi:hypothetical protein
MSETPCDTCWMFYECPIDRNIDEECDEWEECTYASKPL